jgi:A-factor biosynthesis hotdog domain
MRQTDSLPITPSCRPAVRKPSWQSISGVDLAHPFYFDHPIDHVPGIMLIVELFGLVRQAVKQDERAPGIPADRGWLRTSLSFPRFGELDSETELRVWPSLRPGQWTFAAEQGQLPTCVGTVSFLRAAPQAVGGPVPAYPSAPSPRKVPGHLVHRCRPENILLGEAGQEESGPMRCAVFSPGSDDHLFTVLGGAERTPEELIEAARQATVMLWSRAFGWPVDTRLTLNSVSAELPDGVDRGVPLELRWWPHEIKGNKASTSFEFVADSGVPELVGSVTICSQAWSERAWQRIRSVQRREAAAAGELSC